MTYVVLVPVMITAKLNDIPPPFVGNERRVNSKNLRIDAVS